MSYPYDLPKPLFAIAFVSSSKSIRRVALISAAWPRKTAITQEFLANANNGPYVDYHPELAEVTFSVENGSATYKLETLRRVPGVYVAKLLACEGPHPPAPVPLSVGGGSTMGVGARVLTAAEVEGFDADA